MLSRSTDLLHRLRSIDVADRIGDLDASGDALLAEWQSSGVRFASSSERGALERTWTAPSANSFRASGRPARPEPILHEGGIYLGCWLESTGTINAELLSRFLPSVAARTFMAFAEVQRDDGLLPYKLTANGPVFAQIQTVTPLARSVWTHHRLNGSAPGWLEKLYRAMRRNDDWLARWRNTRGTGAVEAFCCYDTGHSSLAALLAHPRQPLRDGSQGLRPIQSVAAARRSTYGERGVLQHASSHAWPISLATTRTLARQKFMAHAQPHGALLRCGGWVLRRQRPQWRVCPV